jgi:hypothetical protein
MSDDKTWSMKDMEMVWSEGNTPESTKPDAPVNQLAPAVKKPAHHNSKVKAALLLLGGTCLAVLGTLFFTLTSGKTPEKIAATAPETTQPVAASNDGWETAAKQSASDAGAGINIPSNQKSDTESSPTPSATTQPTKPVGNTTASTAQSTSSPVNSSTTKTEPKPPASVVAPVAKASPAVKTPTQVVAAAPPVVAKPIVTQPVAPKAIPQIAAASPVKPAPTVVAKAAAAQPPVAKPIAQAPIASPEPKAIAQAPIATLAPKAIAKPEVKPETKPVTPPVAVASNPAPAATPISWEQASAAGVYGGDPADSAIAQPVGGLGVAAGVKDGGKDGKQQQQAQRQQSNYEGAMSPTLLLAAGTNVKGHTLAPYTVGISKEQSEAVPLSIALDEPIELDKGYRLPKGTTITFNASVRDNGSVVAVSKNADIGGVEIQLPEGAISLASDNNGLLMAKEVSTGDGDLARADMNSVIWGAAAGAGKAILQSGSQTATNTGLLGTTTIQTNNGSPNILGGVLQGGFDPLAANGQRRAEQTADRIEKRSKLNTIDVNTKVKLFVNASVQVQIPVSGQQVGQVAEEQEELPPPPRLITSNSVPSATENELPPQQVSVAPQSSTQTPAVLPPAPAQPVAPLPQQLPQTPVKVPKQSITTTPPLNPPKTRTSTTW